MAIKKITGIPEIDAIANALNKKFGGKSIVSMGPKKSLSEVKVIPTGSVYLDCTLGTAGFPDNRIIEIYGPPSAGKTSMALQFMSQYVKERGYEKPPLFIDLERTTGLDLIESMGIDPNKLVSYSAILSMYLTFLISCIKSSDENITLTGNILPSL